MISQPQVEPANNIGARQRAFLSSYLARSAVVGAAAVTHHFLIAPRTKPGTVIRPGLDTLLKDSSLYTSPVTRSRSRKLHYVDTWGPAGVWLARRTRTKRGGQRYSQLFTDQRRVFPLKLQ
jgi:hypothetical protein